MTGLLINERFIAVFPSLVRRLGSIDAAALAQTIHYEAQESGEGDGWVKLTNEEWGDRLGLSKDQIQRLMTRLVNVGAIEREQFGKAKYDRVSSSRIVHSFFQEDDQDFRDETPGHSDDAESHLRSGESDLRTSDSASSRRCDSASSSSLEEKEENTAREGDFELFWQIYPRKESKPPAARAWKGLGSRDRSAALEALPLHVGAWQRTRTEKRFIPYPATWLNQRRWEDELNGDAAPTQQEYYSPVTRQAFTKILPNGEVVTYERGT